MSEQDVGTVGKGEPAQLVPVLPLRDIVVFPHMIVPLFVGREKSVRALDEVMNEEKQILLLTQKNAADDDPTSDGLHQIGTLATVLQLLKLPDQTVRVLVEGKSRARVTGFVPRNDFFQASIERVPESAGEARETEALVRTVKTNFEQYIKLNKKVPAETLASVAQIDEPAKLADTVASHLSVKIADRQGLLETLSTGERLERVLSLIESEIGVLQVERKIKSRVKRQMEKTQREYYLNEQLKAIQKELGEGEEGRDELNELEDRIRKAKLSKEAREKATGEVRKLRQMSPMSAEATVVRNYLDWILSLPWGKKSKVKKDIKLAEDILNEDHYGLEKVKERILEYLAVQQRAGKMKGPILCLVGPPGVGKTSLGKSIARATGREFVRMSLGGVRDEAEIRGHRRTYIGSMPGKVIQSMKKAKSANPLFLLDEIDKLGADWRGDPSSALLEVLDPEQNHAFNDHYLEVDFDLSDVMFITTANTLRMPQPLMDRMEIIRIPGYTEDEKVEIAKRHLIPKQMKAHGLKDEEWKITDEGLHDLIRYHTREAGVRNLEREIANLARKAVKEIVSNKAKSIVITQENVDTYAGVRQYRYGEMDAEDQVGVVTGLAWTEAGGDTLQIEVRHAARQGPHANDGQTRRRDEGIDRCGALLCAFQSDDLRHQAADIREGGHPCACAGRRDAQGRTFGRRGDGGVHHLGVVGHCGAPRCGDDGRGDATRTRSADRRLEGKTARGSACRVENGHHPAGKREGPGRNPRQCEVGAEYRAGIAGQRSVEGRACAPARADRLGRA